MSLLLKNYPSPQLYPYFLQCTSIFSMKSSLCPCTVRSWSFHILNPNETLKRPRGDDKSKKAVLKINYSKHILVLGYNKRLERL